MDINKMLADLRAEREQIEEAIMTLERLARDAAGAVVGRPPGCPISRDAAARRAARTARRARPKVLQPNRLSRKSKIPNCWVGGSLTAGRYSYRLGRRALMPVGASNLGYGLGLPPTYL